MALDDVLTAMRRDHAFMANVAVWRTLPAQPPQLTALPPDLHPLLVAGLRQRGIERLYAHQAEALAHSAQGENVVVITPTASGKTLTYQLPVLQALIHDSDARALYLFPTKALAQDQMASLREWSAELSAAGAPVRAATYDGDTPSADRARIRNEARIILSNPDMLHIGILPNHTQWARFFGGLRYVVLDELHTYRGVFGSHVANVMRRLLRICAHYGSKPQFVCTSATIANPQQLAELIIEQPVHVVTRNGAPRGEKQIILYNPPMYDLDLGLRRSAVLEAQETAARCVSGGVQTIVFARTRLTTELLLTYLRDTIARDRDAHLDAATAIRGYRGGYLPEERRAIELGLRTGEVRAVTATNALELGIDIGQLQSAVLCGYPGSIASLWQQMGRAGRTRETALAVLVATGQPIDQYIMQHPEFVFARSPEHALINPDNLMLLVDQMRCAAFELPFVQGERFGASPYVAEVLTHLVEQGDLQEHRGRYLWAGEPSPARQISLRSSGNNPVVVQVDGPNGSASTRIIGEVDDWRAPAQVHEGAVYLHEGATYLVDKLALDDRIATVRPANVDFYTTVDIDTNVEVIAEHEHKETPAALIGCGDVRVSSQVVSFRRTRRFTHEVIGVEPLDFAPHHLETTGYWFQITPAAQRRLAEAGNWFDSVNDYGPNWQAQRAAVRVRDQFRCTQCGALEPAGKQHDVHHLTPFRTFGYVAGLNQNYLQANQLANLVLVCRTCHRRLENAVRTRSALQGLGYALYNLAPLYLMCDREDLGVHVERADGLAEAPTSEHTRPQPQPMEPEIDFYGNGDSNGHVNGTLSASSAPEPVAAPPSASAPKLAGVTLYENIAAGLGFHLRLYELHDTLLRAARELIVACPCENGCPACVGPVLEGELLQGHEMDAKRVTLALIEEMLRT